MKKTKKSHQNIFRYLESRNFQSNKTGLIEFLLYEDKLPIHPKMFQYHQYINYYYANKTIKELLKYL